VSAWGRCDLCHEVFHSRSDAHSHGCNGKPAFEEKPTPAQLRMEQGLAELERVFPAQPPPASEGREWWDWDMVQGICARSGTGVIGETDRQAIRALVSEFTALKAEVERKTAHVEDLQRANRERAITNESYAAGEMATELYQVRQENVRFKTALIAISKHKNGAADIALDVLEPRRAAQSECTCPPKKYDGQPFDGVGYYCPLHGR
jgi:hypothetical protein